MNEKTLRATAAIVICCVLMILIVIYTPKPTPEPTKKRETFEEILQRLNQENAHIWLVNEALKKEIEARTAVHKAVRRDDGKKVYLETAHLNPLIEMHTKALEALTEASESVKQHNTELQRLDVEEVHLKSLLEANVKANTKLIATLTEMSTEIQAFTELLQRFTEENAHHPLAPFMGSFQYTKNSTKMGVVGYNAQNADSEAAKAHFEFRRAMFDARRL